MKQKRTQKILISKFSLTLQPNRNGESAYKVVGFCVILLWWRWRELHRLLRNLPPFASLFGRLGPLPTHQFTELIRFTVALFRVRLSSTFPSGMTKPTFTGGSLHVWWRWRESNSRPKAFPQNFLRAQLVFCCFASLHAHQQAGKSAISLFPYGTENSHKVFLYGRCQVPSLQVN